jgi:hypothetical protein
MTTEKTKVLFWGKPAKARPQKDHNEISFDGGPPGGYQPNMSADDAARWRAKLVKGEFSRVEIRKTGQHGTQMLIIVSESGKGFPRSYEKPERNKGINVCISMNGPAKLSFKDWDEMQEAITEARWRLNEA